MKELNDMTKNEMREELYGRRSMDKTHTLVDNGTWSSLNDLNYRLTEYQERMDNSEDLNRKSLEAFIRIALKD